ncbi:unnamed protein product [Urochloa decumbens]|uniref:Uncharacterized protein n=1 Tax=Urochloa decumbens TaxID=240449 RepID=A0ABC8ZI43_9POAL
MAATRSVLAMLGRRCGSSGSSAASSMGGSRGPEIHQALITAAPRTLPLPSIRPPPTRSPRGLRRYSSEFSGRADTSKLLLMNENSESRLFHMGLQRPIGVKTVLEADHYLLALVLFGLTISSGYVMTELWRLKLMPFSGPRTRVPDVDYDNYEDSGEDDD